MGEKEKKFFFLFDCFNFWIVCRESPNTETRRYHHDCGQFISGEMVILYLMTEGIGKYKTDYCDDTTELSLTRLVGSAN